MVEIQSMRWHNDRLEVLDQTSLPHREEWLTVGTAGAVADAIRAMRVRGAPAIGVAAAFGVALAARETTAAGMPEFLVALDAASRQIAQARPTAASLAWTVERCMTLAQACATPGEARERLLAEALRMQAADEAGNRAMGAFGAALLPAAGGVLTHCNTGALATAGYGTALGVIRAAWEAGKRPAVFCTETRPWLQGARLTTWELGRLGIPAQLIVDSAAGALMRNGEVNAVIVGADRIAANGDTANKIGTYTLAVLAHAHGVPFYVAAAVNSVDLTLPHGGGIPIEERAADEVTHVAGTPMAAAGTRARNPAFDVTPARLIGAIITERGIARAPYVQSLRTLAGRHDVAVATRLGAGLSGGPT